MIEEIYKQSARELLKFIEQSPTAAHAASLVETRLVQAGYWSEGRNRESSP
jgi:aspartyl aminopeptidase